MITFVSMSIEFKRITVADLPAVTTIYNYYVRNSTATFHLEEVSQDELAATLSLGHEKYQSFVILDDQKTIGFCYLSPFRKKEAYDMSAELTLYIDTEYTGKGTGKIVLSHLEVIAKANGINNLIGVITAENTNSVSLFEKAGYFKCGHLKNIGKKFGRTLDVVSYQKEI